MSEQYHTPTLPSQHEAQARIYLEMLRCLNPELKIMFHAMKHFADARTECAFRGLMEREDEDINTYFASRREDDAKDVENMKEKSQQRHAIRVKSGFELSDIVDVATPYFKQRSELVKLLTPTLRPHDHAWHHELHGAYDKRGELLQTVIVGKSAGSTSWLVQEDPETKQLALGDRCHNFMYDSAEDRFVGSLGSGLLDLDNLGRTVRHSYLEGIRDYDCSDFLLPLKLVDSTIYYRELRPKS